VSKKKKHHHEEHEEHVNHEAWVIPYADMLTLLMALFLVMWATGQTDVNKMKSVAAGFADSLGIEGNGHGVGGAGILEGASDVVKGGAETDLAPKVGEAMAALEEKLEKEQAARDAQAQLDGIEKSITDNAQQAGQAGELAFRDESRGLIVSIVADGVLFDAGSDQLRPEGRQVLDNIAAVLRVAPNRVSVEGHTDNRPINTARFPSNWDLSTGRAVAVLNYLVNTHHLDAKRLAASGYGDQHPIDSNDTLEGRARNRRVEIAVLTEVGSAAPVDPAQSAPPSTIFDPLAGHSSGETHSETTSHHEEGTS